MTSPYRHCRTGKSDKQNNDDVIRRIAFDRRRRRELNNTQQCNDAIRVTRMTSLLRESRNKDNSSPIIEQLQLDGVGLQSVAVMMTSEVHG